jgi:sulfur-carrier protein
MSLDVTGREPTDVVAVRIAVPSQLRDLAGVRGEIVVEVAPPVTLAATIDALETVHPTLAGTIRDRGTGTRRPMIRIYADGEDCSDAAADAVLPAAVVTGREPLRVVGSIAGG